MALPTNIVDGEGTSVRAGVTTKHALKVQVEPFSTKDALETGALADLLNRGLYRAFFKDTSGSSNLVVNGSAASPIKFSVAAEEGIVKFLTGIRLFFRDLEASVDANGGKFGKGFVGGLTNGIRMYTVQGGVETHLLVEPVKTMAEFLYYAEDFVSLKDAIASDDIVTFDFAVDAPVILAPGYVDAMNVEIQDNLSGASPPLVVFRALARGYRELL